jgi:DNA polymerase V
MLFALIDCNNFYASCERAFNPSLENKPIVVLSNNDGCIISRSNEAKKLKIPMGAPYFKWESFCLKNHVHVFSSNYELYGDMSRRVMALLREFNSRIEVYSIDEAFLFFKENISAYELSALRNQIKQSTGIPTSIGVGSTKTLAKLANYLAKDPKNNDVFFLSETEQNRLDTLPVEKIWGVGRRLTNKLKLMNIDTASKLKNADSKMIRLHFSVTLEKTVQELNGISCLGIESPQDRKQVVASRSFGKKLTDLTDLEEAISHYTHIAARKLRKQKSVTSSLSVFLQTSIFSEDGSQYSNCTTLPLSSPTSDTRYLIRIAKQCLRSIYKVGYQYHKAGVILSEISQEGLNQYDLLQETVDLKSDTLMQTVDNINSIMGKNTVFIAAEGIQRPWSLRCNKRSLRCTTRWDELLTVFCG